MLSEKSAVVVRSTLPVVGGAIGQITPVFYRRMFTARLDLLRDLFNRANQANGTQSRALAGSIATFAEQLLAYPDQRPDRLLARIAHKHASLGITADQYTIVHEHLFAALGEVLGDALTDEAVVAWDEVYWLMAGALIALETRLYAQAGVRDGDVWKPWRVIDRVEETDDVVTFMLRPADRSPAPPFQPGQYVSVRVELPDGAHQIRQYSLSCAPNGTDRWISVKRIAGSEQVPEGEVSTWLHAHVRTGDLLTVSAPFGDVILEEDDSPVLLASAGIGATPMVSMLAHLAHTGATRRVVTVHGDRRPDSHPFRAELELLTDRLPNADVHIWYEEAGETREDDRTGLVDVSGIDIPADTSAYLCGPVPFMRAVRGQLLERGVSAARIHYEVFGPDLGLTEAA